MSMIGDNSKTFIDIGRLSDNDKTRLKNAVKELGNSYARAEAERELQREILNEMNEAIGIEKTVLRKVAKVHYKQNIDEEIESQDRFRDSYETLIGGIGG